MRHWAILSLLILAGCSASQPAPRDTPAVRPVATAQPVAVSPGQPVGKWTWPAKGEVIGRFNAAAGATGLDIAGARGSPVLAAAAGRVSYVGTGLRGYGRLVIVKHSDTVLSAYAHNDRVLVVEGQSVKFGQVIAVMGNSDADRVKLHFEIRENGRPVDPMRYLPG
jgi:lipoprotein NlpD